MVVDYKDFLEIASDIMNLGLSLRQDQLNGNTDKSGNQALEEYLADKFEDGKPDIVIVGMGSGGDVSKINNLTKAIEQLHKHHKSVIVVGDPRISDTNPFTDVKPMSLTIPDRSFVNEKIILDDKLYHPNPETRKGRKNKRKY